MTAAASWSVQDFRQANIHGKGVALREFVLDAGKGFADYPRDVDGKARGVIEATVGKARFTLARWLDTMQWIERNSSLPTGFGQLTRPEIAGVTGGDTA